VISASSNYAIAHTTPSPNKSQFSQAETSTPPSGASGKATVFLSADKGRSGLASVHAFSGQAVKVSHQTLKFIDKMIDKAIGGPGSSVKGKVTATSPTPTSQPSSAFLAPDSKPPLPPRRTPSPDGAAPGPSTKPPQLPPRNLSRKARLVLSADLILSTLDESVKQLLDVSTGSIDAFVSHK
jgi:spartin